jgi:hypothetical protein
MAKERNAFFQKVYNARWDYHYKDGTTRKGYFNNCVWKQAFGGCISANLPQTWVEHHRIVWSSDNSLGICLKLRPANEKGCRKHRVFLGCKKCGKDVQAGRIAQHRC